MAGNNQERFKHGELFFTLWFKILFIFDTSLHSPKLRRRKCCAPDLC